MRAVVMRGGDLLVDDVPRPIAGPGQILVRPIATGICGSDLSAWQHTDQFLQASLDSGTHLFVFDPARDLVMGHEFSAEVVAVGPGVDHYAAGDKIVAKPMVVDSNNVVRCVGYATDFPGALGEYVVLGAGGDMPLHPHIPAGLDPYLAALTEPLTVGFNAVGRSQIAPTQGAVVVGCGPVGLGALVGLKERGVGDVVVSDPSRARREIALAHGAYCVVDPAETDPIDAWRELTNQDRQLFVFECSGMSGMLNSLLYSVPRSTTIVVSGSCMVDDPIRPVVGIYKNVRIDFCMGPDATFAPTDVDEFEATLKRLADGAIDASRLVTAWAPLEAAADAFAALRPHDAHGIEHFKILVRNDLDGDRLLAGPASEGGAPWHAN